MCCASVIPSFLKMHPLSALLVTLQLIVFAQLALGANILFFHSLATSSHRTSIWPLAEELADRGHNVTYIFPMDERRLGNHPQIVELVPSKMLPIIKYYLGDFDINIRLNNTVNQWLFQVLTKSVDLCEAFYDSPEIQTWLSQKHLHYDLLLIDGTFGECAYGLVHKFKSKFILFYPTLVPPFTYDAFGVVAESASNPDGYFHKKPGEMSGSIWNRMLSTLSVFMWRLGQLNFVRQVHPVIQKSFPDTVIPSLLEIEGNASLVLVNWYFVEDYPLSLPPMMQSYSGLWCSKKKLQKTRKSLPKDIEEFVKGGEEGFVYVSFGSAVVASGMPERLRNEIFEGFGALPKIRFLWRWPGNTKVENVPKNVMLRNWFPQQDVLADGRIRAFVTQAGRPSTQEALCYGVPMIAIPIFGEKKFMELFRSNGLSKNLFFIGDQYYNADRLEQIGAAIILDIGDLSSESLKQGISRVVNTDKYKTRAKELSAMFRDRPIDPLEKAVYYVEYVLKHNTELLKPLGMNNTWWKRRLLDVYAGLVIGLGGIGFILWKLIRLCAKKCARGNDKKSKME